MKNKPDSAGMWMVGTEYNYFGTYEVECGPSSGIFCRGLKMGGSSRCGFADWDRDLQWTKID